VKAAPFRNRSSISQAEHSGQETVDFMNPEYFKIVGGTVYDPANGIDGEVRDIWIAGSQIVEPPGDPGVRPARVLDARGLVVMPGGVDMHCHIVGPKVNTARKMCPEQKRRSEPVLRTRLTHSGITSSVPSTFATGYKYAGLGYTTAFDAAISPLSARHAHEEFEDSYSIQWRNYPVEDTYIHDHEVVACQP
jgi:formylmethanofuran dehydrogenase subunit A